MKEDNGFHSQRLASENDRNQFLKTIPLDRGVVKKEWVLLAGFPKNYNASQRIKYLSEQEYIRSEETGKKYGKVSELAYFITDKGVNFRVLITNQDKEEKPKAPKAPKAPNFDLFNENKESPIAILMNEIAEMEHDLKTIKKIASKYMDEIE